MLVGFDCREKAGLVPQGTRMALVVVGAGADMRSSAWDMVGIVGDWIGEYIVVSISR